MADHRDERAPCPTGVARVGNSTGLRLPAAYTRCGREEGPQLCDGFPRILLGKEVTAGDCATGHFDRPGAPYSQRPAGLAIPLIEGTVCAPEDQHWTADASAGALIFL